MEIIVVFAVHRANEDPQSEWNVESREETEGKPGS